MPHTLCSEKKWNTLFLVITSANVDQLSKFFQ